MKKSSSLVNAFSAVLFSFFAITMVAFIMGLSSPMMYGVGGVALTIVQSAVSFILDRPALPSGIAMAGLNKEIWIKQLMLNYYPSSGFLQRSQDMTEFVENNTINLADCGVDPVVIWNNTTYPVPMVARADNPIAIPLEYADTENTVIRNARKVEFNFNMMEVSIKQHRASLVASSSVKTLHAYAPAAAVTNKVRLLEATGATRADGSKALTINDLVDYDSWLNGINAPYGGRICVLSLPHKADLAKADLALYKSFLNWKSGEPLPFLNFEFYQSGINATYSSALAKKAIGATAAAGDRQATQIWLESEVMRADGDVEMFETLRDARERGDIVGFQKRFIAMPIRQKALGAIL